jgi:chromosome segregation ATPase
MTNQKHETEIKHLHEAMAAQITGARVQAEGQIAAIKERANQLVAEERRQSETKLAEERRAWAGQAEQFKMQQTQQMAVLQNRVRELEAALAGEQNARAEQMKQFQTERQIFAADRARIEKESSERAARDAQVIEQERTGRAQIQNQLSDMASRLQRGSTAYAELKSKDDAIQRSLADAQQKSTACEREAAMVPGLKAQLDAVQRALTDAQNKIQSLERENADRIRAFQQQQEQAARVRAIQESERVKAEQDAARRHQENERMAATIRMQGQSRPPPPVPMAMSYQSSMAPPPAMQPQYGNYAPPGLNRAPPQPAGYSQRPAAPPSLMPYTTSQPSYGGPSSYGVPPPKTADPFSSLNPLPNKW